MARIKQLQIDKHHPAADWILDGIRKDPRLTDMHGEIKVPVDAVDMVYPMIGRPYAHVREVFLIDRDDNVVMTMDGLDVRRWPVDVKIRRPR